MRCRARVLAVAQRSLASVRAHRTASHAFVPASAPPGVFAALSLKLDEVKRDVEERVGAVQQDVLAVKTSLAAVDKAASSASKSAGEAALAAHQASESSGAAAGEFFVFCCLSFSRLLTFVTEMLAEKLAEPGRNNASQDRLRDLAHLVYDGKCVLSGVTENVRVAHIVPLAAVKIGTPISKALKAKIGLYGFSLRNVFVLVESAERAFDCGALKFSQQSRHSWVFNVTLDPSKFRSLAKSYRVALRKVVPSITSRNWCKVVDFAEIVPDASIRPSRDALLWASVNLPFRAPPDGGASPVKK